ncbi:MAG: 50S ribosomal protein L31 [Candidatus Parcubacteria bacterium]|nr:50S ribosomal protein L31 [Candidatus Parcubacteria bacterium]
MKKEIHPKYFPKAKIICNCGNIITAGSTVAETHVEVCSKCHPFYTGKQKLMDTSGRLERFKKIVARGEQLSKLGKAKKVSKAAKSTKKN